LLFLAEAPPLVLIMQSMICRNTVRKATPDNDEPVAGFVFHEMKRE